MEYSFNTKTRWSYFTDTELSILLNGLKQMKDANINEQIKTSMSSELISEISKRDLIKNRNGGN